MNDQDKNDMLIGRRKLLGAASLFGLSMLIPVTNVTAQQGGSSSMPRSGSRPVVNMLVYPRMVLMDLIGPMTVMNILGAKVNLVWKDKTPVSTDVGIPITATTTLSECPSSPDVLFVPGGIMGTINCMNDSEVCDFIAAQGEMAQYVTSVCTGSLVLAAAGLLNGYKATSHWTVAELLPLMGASNTDERVVKDRNRITGGGVTAGIDFGLTLAALLKSEEDARRVQLILEYDPEPPFSNGTPQQAGPERVAAMRSMRPHMDEMAREASEIAGKRLGLMASNL